ncbi:MAG: hypothetical protein ACXVXJ_11375 [Mycobacteriaceae bacterium]
MTRWTDEQLGRLLSDTFTSREQLADPVTAHRIAVTVAAHAQPERRRHRWTPVAGVAALIVCAVAIGAVVLAQRPASTPTDTPHPTVRPTPTVRTYADNVAAAAAASTRVVSLAPVPADAQPLHEQPAAWPTDSGMELGPSDPKLTRVRWWSVPETPAAVQRHLLTHTPDGMARDEGIGYSTGTPFVIYGVRTNPQPDAYINPSLLVMWRPNGTRTLIRAESFTSARNVRPLASYIRGSVSSLDIARIVPGTSTYPAGRHVPTVHLTAEGDEPAISKVVQAVNALPGSVAVGWFGSCPMISDPRPSFTLTFHTTAGTVRMHLELGCWGLVEVHRDGRPVTPSLDPGGLNEVVNRVANAVTLSSRSAH